MSFTHYRIGVPKGIRTPVTAVKGQCPRPLDDGDTKIATESVIQYFCVKVRMWQHIRTTDAVKTRYRTFTAQSSPSSTGALAHYIHQTICVDTAQCVS